MSKMTLKNDLQNGLILGGKNRATPALKHDPKREPKRTPLNSRFAKKISVSLVFYSHIFVFRDLVGGSENGSKFTPKWRSKYLVK